MGAWHASIAGNFRTNVAKIEAAHKRAARFAVRTGGTALKNGLRRDVIRAKLGQGIANAIRDKSYPPSGLSMDPAVVISSKAIYKRPGGLVDIITVFREGALIRPLKGVKAGLFLAVGARKIASLLKGGFRLTREVFLAPRLKHIDENYARVNANLQPNYERAFERELAKVA